MIKEWYYEAFINGKKYRVDCVESDGYGGSRVRTERLILIDEGKDENTFKISKKNNQGDEVEKRTEDATTK